MQARARNRDGYVLVMTLGLLTLIAISLSGLARYSLSVAVHSREAADSLQRRWALVSIRQSLLDSAGQILDAKVPTNEFNTPPWPKPASDSFSFTLGSQRFRVTLADEDAKLNLNAVSARKHDQLRAVLQRLSKNRSKTSRALRLMPQPTTHVPFQSWGQVFELTNGGFDMSRSGPPLIEATQSASCWGQGRINLRRASDAVVREAASLTLPADKVSELVEKRQHWGGQDINELLNEMGLRRGQALAAARYFGIESSTYSIWVQVGEGHRTRTYQYVSDGELVSFEW